MSAPASISCRVPAAVTTLPATIGDVGRHRPHGLDRPQHPRLVPVGGVDDEDVDAGGDERLGLRLRVAVDADGDGDHQPPVGVDRRPVDRRAQRALAGDHPDQAAVGVDDGLHRAPVGGQQLERLARRRAVGDGHQLAAHHDVQLREAVEADGVLLGEHAERPPAVVDDDDRAVRPLVDQPEGVGDRVVRRQRDRRLVDRVARLDVVDVGGDDVERDVLRAAPRCPPRRATVSAIRRPATAVMLPTTTGRWVPMPSGVVRSTSRREPTADRLGTMKTSLYVRS